MVFFDVVYNHFEPEGNYLHVYAKPFFTDRYHTPWGSAIDFKGPRAAMVRRSIVENVLFWLEEFVFRSSTTIQDFWSRVPRVPPCVSDISCITGKKAGQWARRPGASFTRTFF
jgi:hypothetical protein